MNKAEANRVWVKICGITNRDDALAAIDAGVDALGFNLWPGSKRYVPLEENAEWIAALPSGVEKIAVVVNAPLAQALAISSGSVFDAVQFHGDEDAGYLAEFAAHHRPFIIARRLQQFDTALPLSGTLAPRILIDAAVPGEFGGTGVRLDYHLGKQFVDSHPQRQVILAGGLTPENVAEAIGRVAPYGVDVASGVEKTTRAKDWSKMRQFVAASRQK
jgi:phosphoribosylanthranilate isomerase